MSETTVVKTKSLFCQIYDDLLDSSLTQPFRHDEKDGRLLMFLVAEMGLSNEKAAAVIWNWINYCGPCRFLFSDSTLFPTFFEIIRSQCSDDNDFTSKFVPVMSTIIPCWHPDFSTTFPLILKHYLPTIGPDGVIARWIHSHPIASLVAPVRALEIAIVYGNYPVFQMLVQAGEKIDASYVKNLVRLACSLPPHSSYYIAKIKLFIDLYIEQGVDIYNASYTSDGETLPLHKYMYKICLKRGLSMLLQKLFCAPRTYPCARFIEGKRIILLDDVLAEIQTLDMNGLKTVSKAYTLTGDGTLTLGDPQEQTIVITDFE